MLRKMCDVDIKLGLKNVLNRINEAKKKRSFELQCVEPRLVAVTKIKPVEDIIAAYDAGQRHFGENYVQELADKAVDPQILEKCKDIRWHLIGHLQTNKINKVLSLPNLHVIETVHSEKLASNLNKSWPKFAPEGSKLRVMVQVNTSKEEEKSGIDPANVCELTKYVINECPNLQLDGLMTIGLYEYDLSDGPNPDFLLLKRCRDEVCQNLGLDWKTVHLSMGMSNDFEHAIELGSTSVRVGRTIFGERQKH